ncbi:unnamed protein product [Brassica rapa]|uniref:Uncharacterized protein n=2 Tax=Brassica TaxID=3705 RepID=A0A3P6APP7_BRACM|nr:unnamed protein product [Brassica napus]CAG7893869.1 unnamed protein product [Brassica rapa]CAF2045591.1 unnamed protein product [Brassica napus]CAF2275906.1 unnamed protein product [Brassica napus]CDY68256.1 BnaAnng26640D [Brassica napus]
MNRRTKQRNFAMYRSCSGTSELLGLVRMCFNNVNQTVIENHRFNFSTKCRSTMYDYETLCNCQKLLEKIYGGLVETTAGKLVVMFSNTVRRALRMKKVYQDACDRSVKHIHTDV